MGYGALLGKLGGMMGGMGGGGGGGMMGGLDPAKAVGGALSGWGKGLMSGGFEKAYTGGSQGGYDALMQGARLDNIRSNSVDPRAMITQGLQEADLVNAQRKGPATGAVPGLKPSVGGQ